MPLDYTDPETLKYIIERNGYENRERLRWFFKHKDEEIRRAQFSEKHKHYTEGEILKKTVQESIPALAVQHEENHVHRRRKPPKLETSLNPLTVETVPEVPIMKPVDAAESSLLYKPLTLGGGRKTYLNSRKRKLPEDKYNSCQTSSVYGWGLRHSEITFRASKCTRYATFLHDLHWGSGVHPDPPHYMPPTERIYKKCIGFE